MCVLKSYREKNNLSQKALANRLGVSQTFISKVELGKRFFSYKQAIQIEKKLRGALKREHLRPDIFGSP